MDVHPTKLQATPERLKMKGLEYCKWKCEDQQRIIEKLSNTPLLPSQCQVLQTIKASKRQLNKHHGSFTMQSLVAKKQKRMEEQEQQDKVKQSKKKNAEKEKNKKDAIKNHKMEEWKVDNPNFIMCECWKVGGRACTNGNLHLCGNCGEVKTKTCRAAACKKALGYAAAKMEALL